MGVYRDVTDLETQSNQLEVQLRATEIEKNRWQALFDNVEEAIVVTNQDCFIVQANPAAELLSGLNQKEILGKKFYEVFELQNDRGIKLVDNLALGKTVLRTREPIEYVELKFKNYEDREIWLGVSVTPVQISSNGKAQDQVIHLMRDISKLKEIDEAKSDFVSMASHELRTPLTVINGYLSLFMSGDLGNINDPRMEPYRKILAQIHKNTERLNQLVEDLLNVSRIEQGRLTLTFEPTNLPVLIREVVDDMSTHAQRKNIAVKYKEPISNFLNFPLIVVADYDKIKQVLINLVDNAVKYTAEGGLIEISVKRTGRDVVVSVRDNGMGIPKSVQPRIFEKFQRVPGSYTKDIVGTGLGLYIVREILKAHQGTVWVESEAGKGSVFHFSLPLQANLR